MSEAAKKLGHGWVTGTADVDTQNAKSFPPEDGDATRLKMNADTPYEARAKAGLFLTAYPCQGQDPEGGVIKSEFHTWNRVNSYCGICGEPSDETWRTLLLVYALDAIACRHHSDTCQHVVIDDGSFPCNCHVAQAQAALKKWRSGVK